MRRVIAACAAGGMLIAGAFVASTISSDAASAAEGDTSATADSDPASMPRPREAMFEEVIASLVDDGTLTQAQADAVKERFVAAHEEHVAEREARRAEHEAIREQIEGFLDDDVISADELAQLPEDHPLRDPEGPFADALADGQISRAELADVGHERRQERRDRIWDRLTSDA